MAKSEQTDVLILGSAFGGSLLSMILVRSGLTVAVVDKTRHPRFAIGESSTPLADATLAQLATEYDLPELLPLSKYGTWKQACPGITCGLKRGFSYFGHRSVADFSGDQQMLVAASRSDALSDTHWLRSDVDEFFFRRAAARGVRQFVGAEYRLKYSAAGWQAEGVSDGRTFSLSAPFVVDATGAAGTVLRYLQIPSQENQLQTHSAAVFAHFADVRTVGSMLDELRISRSQHPFPCDAAAVHHVFADGWMWQLRFDDDTVSAGFLLTDRHRLVSEAPEKAWQQQLRRIPFLSAQFAKASIVRPAGGLQVSGRLQRLAVAAAGENWAALPNTAGFIDPLHSTGIAHTLCGVRRLARIITGSSSTKLRGESLAAYSNQVLNELLLVDELVSGCYASQPEFRLWCDWCMLYFAAATSMEHADDDDNGSFLHADNADFRSLLSEARQQRQMAVDAGSGDVACRRFEDWLADALRPWNHVGLLDPACHGMYAQTAAPD